MARAHLEGNRYGQLTNAVSEMVIQKGFSFLWARSNLRG
jgi:hypothetical protein